MSRVEMVEWKPPHILRDEDVVFRALDAARIALFKAQRGDGDIAFDAVDRLLSEAMDVRFAEKR